MAMRVPAGVRVVLLAVATTAGAGGFEELPLVHFTTEHELTPLPSASVQKVMQDSQGLMWMGFYSSGLARYDGRRLQTFGREDGLPSVTVREVVEDSESRLWVGTESGLAVAARPLRELGVGERPRFLTEVDGRPLVRQRVHRSLLVVDRTGGVWVGTRGRLLTHYRIDKAGHLGEREVRLSPAPESPTEEIGVLTVRRDGSLWVGTTAGRLLVIDSETGDIRTVSAMAGSIQALHEGPSGTLWAGSADGTLWRLDEAQETLSRVSRSLHEWVLTILETSTGEVWAGTLGGGLLVLSAGDVDRERHLTRQHGLLSNTVWSIALDREGNLWMGQNGGLSRLRPNFRAFGVVTARACAPVLGSLPEPGVFCSLPDPPPAGGAWLWLGTGAGLVAFDAQGSCDVLDVRRGLISNSAYGIAVDWQQRFWVTTPRGLSVVSFAAPLPAPLAGSTTGKVTVHGVSGSVRSYPLGLTYATGVLDLPTRVASVTAASQWVMGAHGVACHLDQVWLFFGERTGVGGSAATGLAVDGESFVWVSTLDAGLLRSLRPLTRDDLLALSHSVLPGGGREITEPVFTQVWSSSTGAPTDSVNTLVQVQGRIWAGTARGLFAFGGTPPMELARLDGRNGLGGEIVRGLAVCPRTGKLWVSQSAGIAEVDPATATVVRTVGKAEGLADNETWAYSTISAGSDGTIYLSTPKGLAVYRPWLDIRSPFPPPVAIRHVTFHEDLSGNNELVAEYAALTFTNERGVRFRTRLSGYEGEWSEPTDESRIRYTNLPAFLFPRTFVLEVTAANRDGVWSSEPARHRFTVRPPWWFSWIAVVAYVTAIAFGLGMHTRHHSRRLTRKAEELEREVKARTAEIRSQAAELETLDSIVEAINRQMTLRSVLQALLDHGLRLVPQADKALFTVHDPATERYHVAALSGWAPGVFDGLALTEQEALTRYSERAEQLREGVFIVREFEGLPGTEQLPGVPVPRAMLSMAMTLDGKIEGFLVFDNFTDPEAFSSADIQRLERFRQHAISAISKARLLEELRQRTLEAQQASAAKSAFLARMSHELRTPLNSIIGFSEILAERIGVGLEPRYQRFLTNISAAGTHLLGLINDILDLSKIEAGRMQLAPESVALRPLAEGVITAMRGVAAERHIAIELRAQSDLPAIEADPVRIKQVLFNLLSNAVKFSPDGAVVRLEIEALKNELETSSPDAIQIRVVDRGIGIETEQLDRVFGEFVQADDSTSRRYGGTGLGLALVRRFVEMHGGTVGVESTPGLGSTFTVVLPVVFPGGAIGVS